MVFGESFHPDVVFVAQNGRLADPALNLDPETEMGNPAPLWILPFESSKGKKIC